MQMEPALVWIIREAEFKMQLNVQGFYWRKYLWEKMARAPREVGEFSDGDASLTGRGGKEGWVGGCHALKKVQEGLQGILQPKSCLPRTGLQEYSCQVHSLTRSGWGKARPQHKHREGFSESRWRHWSLIPVVGVLWGTFSSPQDINKLSCS